MILAILVCLLLSWGLARLDRRRAKSSATDLRRLAATFAASCFITLAFAVGFASQAFVDFYVSGRLNELISELQSLPGEVIMWHAGNAFLVALIPAIPATILLHYSRSFLGGIVWATLAVLAALIAQFLIRFWSQPYPGSIGLALFSAIVGMAVTGYFAQAIRCETYAAAPPTDRRRQRGFIGGITGAAMVLSVIVSFAFYYFLVFPIPKPAVLRFNKWDHLMVVGSVEHPVYVGLFGEGLGYQPSIPFQRGVLEEETMRNPLTGELPPQPSRVQLHFAHVLHPSFTMSTENIVYIKGGARPSYGRFLLTIQRFSHCSARDMERLRTRMASGEAGTRLPVDTSGLLEFQTYQSWILHPAQSAPDLNIMLPAWSNDWIHIHPLEGGQGASVGSQAPLAGRARAMILSATGIYLVVAVNPEPTAADRLVIQREGRPRPVPLGGVHTCDPGGRGDTQIAGFIPWERITTDEQTRLSGYLVAIGPATDLPVDQTLGQYMFRLENPDTPTTLKEQLTVPLANRNPVNSLVTGMEATVVGVGMDRDIGQMDGTFGARSFNHQEFGHATIAGERLELRDDPSRQGGLRLSGNARHIVVDRENSFYTFAGQINETVGWAIAGAFFSALLAAIVFLWRRIPRYDAACFRRRTATVPDNI